MNSTDTSWLYILGCLAIPALWGVTSAWLFAKLDARRKAKDKKEAWRPPVDYSI